MEKRIELIVRGLLFREASILLCQSVRHGYWYLPGGHVEFGEAAASAVIREFHEECGLSVRVLDCVLVCEGSFLARRLHHEINLVFSVEAATALAEFVPSREPDVQFAWHDLGALADLDLRPPTIKAWLLAGGRVSNRTCSWVSAIPEVQ